jgi:hypothetical protein
MVLSVFSTIIEAILIGIVVWGFFNERKLAVLEKRLARLIFRRAKLIKK